MNRQKIDFGIDLGTTNSAIAFAENGLIKIIKSTDGNQMDTTPSVVHFNPAKYMFVGLQAYKKIDEESKKSFKSFLTKGEKLSPNTFYEFKRTMGTDKLYPSSNMQMSYSSEELSAEVLKKLRNYVTNENVDIAIITVPANFRQNQLNATLRAAILAGFKYCELLQEPIAASLAYGIDAVNMHGYWLVFDFGGGTFDAALMKVDDGIIKVIDTEGNNRLGGKNIDQAIINKIFVPEIKKKYNLNHLINDELGIALLFDTLKSLSEQAKIELSQSDFASVYMDDIGIDETGEEIVINTKLLLQDYEMVACPIFQQAIDICLKLLARNNLNGSDLETIILIGGPTKSQTLRRMIMQQISSNIQSSVDPMTAVAIGAALYGSTRDIPTNLKEYDKNKAQLILKYPETTVETEEKIGIKINSSKNLLAIDKDPFIEITRTDNAWSSGRIQMQGDSAILQLLLMQNKPNTFSIKLSNGFGNTYVCEPSGFTIIQGLKTPNATLPYSYGIDIFDSMRGKNVVHPLKGLEKTNSLPAKGIGIYKTQKDVRPGNIKDILRIEIYEMTSESVGSSKIRNELIYTVLISGEHFSRFLPAKSDVEICLEFNSSRGIKFTAYFPYLDETIEKDITNKRESEINSEDLLNEIKTSRIELQYVKDNSQNIDLKEVSLLKEQLENMQLLLTNNKNDYDTKTQLKDQLREILKAIDDIKEENEWPEVEDELIWILDRIKVNAQRYGNSEQIALAEHYETQSKAALNQMNTKIAKEIIDEMRSFNFTLIREDLGYWIGYIKHFDAEFLTIEWSNPGHARLLIDEAQQLISSNPTVAKIETIVREIFTLIPEKTKETIIISNDESTLMR